MIVVVFFDLGIAGRAYASALAIPQRVDRKLAADFFAKLIFGESGLLDLVLILLLGKLGVLLALLNFLLDLIVVRDKILFLRFLKQRFLLNQIVKNAEPCGDQLRRCHRRAASARF